MFLKCRLVKLEQIATYGGVETCELWPSPSRPGNDASMWY